MAKRGSQPTGGADIRWTAILPLRTLASAKSRLALELAQPLHRDLVQAMRADTVAAVRAATRVGRVLLVLDAADEPAGDGVEMLIQSSPGLNGAVGDAARYARRRWPSDGLVALVGDLPALSATALDDVLAAAGHVVRGFVADASGAGTTLITACPPASLRPRFGDGSASRHSAVAAALPAADAVRHDVDTLADLHAAAQLGLGPRSSLAYRQLQPVGAE